MAPSSSTSSGSSEDEVEAAEEEGAPDGWQGSDGEDEDGGPTADLLVGRELTHASAAEALARFRADSGWPLERSFAALGALECVRLVNFLRVSQSRGEDPFTGAALGGGRTFADAVREAAEDGPAPLLPPAALWRADDRYLPSAIPGDPMVLLAMQSGGAEEALPEAAPETETDEMFRRAAYAGALVRGEVDEEEGEGPARPSASYFESYSRFSIHREMLSDAPRTRAYQRALERNPSLLRGSRVLDVGCGTGILSLFAARAGAARVVAVDGSGRMARLARAAAAANGFADRVEVLHGEVEALASLPGGPADVLVSEWMGYALLFEGMLDSVIRARDRLLRPGGAVLPDRASLHVAGGGAGSSSVPFWSEVYGFDLSCVGREVHAESARVGVVAPVAAADVVTGAACLRAYDLCALREEEVGFLSEEFELRPGSAPAEVHTLVLWFDVEFSERFCAEEAVRLSTSPLAAPTHWAQTVLHLREPVPLGGGTRSGGPCRWPGGGAGAST